MKTIILKRCVLLLMLVLPTEINAQYNMWAIVTKVKGDAKPVVTEFYGVPETAVNGVKYTRVTTHVHLDDGPYHVVPQQYGMRAADNKLYVFDFVNEKELIAFDFNLSVGDEFATLNGMQWQVKEVTDTLINEHGLSNYSGKHRLLKVQSKDGKWADQWLEGIGSFTNHLMASDLSEMEFSQMPWFMYDFGEYIAREFSCDPIFGHDTGRMEGHYDDNLKDQPMQTISYKDGALTFYDYGLWWPARYYTLYYREGDNIYCLNGWEFLPHVDSGESFWAADKVVFGGLPAPVSGSYTLHINNKDISTPVQRIKASQTAPSLFDLQGRRLTEAPARGMYIQNGKVMMK